MSGETICARFYSFRSIVVKFKVQLRSTVFWIKRTHVAHTVVAIVLILVLLAAATPFDTLASGRRCQMACCVARSLQASSDHCSIEERHRTQTSSSQTSPPSASLASPAMLRHCSSECCTGMLSFARGRRQRDQAMLAHATRHRTSTLVVISRQSIYLALFHSRLCEPSIPRGPPLLTLN